MAKILPALSALKAYLGTLLLPAKATPKLVGLFGLSTGAPILAHEINRIRGENQLSKETAKQVIKRSLYAKTARLEDLSTLRDTMNKARERANKGSGPSVRFKNDAPKPMPTETEGKGPVLGNTAAGKGGYGGVGT